MQTPHRNRRDPSLYDAFRYDVNLLVDPEIHEQVIRDLQRPSRRWFYPAFRWFVRFSVVVILSIKRLLPFLQSVRALNALSIWFARHMVSEEALRYLLLHFHYETAVINFIARNCGSQQVETVDLEPACPEELGDHDGINAMLLHDFNLYNLVIDLGQADDLSLDTPVARDQLCFEGMEPPTFSIPPNSSRWINLDIDTTCYVTGFFLVLLLSEKDFTRALTSLQFDESVMETLSKITGDQRFLFWAPMKFVNWMSHYDDPAKALRWHMYVMEYAYHRLLQLRDSR